ALTSVTVATFDVVDASGSPGSKWLGRIDWGDGNIDFKVPNTPVSGSTFAFMGTHTYALAGNYTITVNMGVPGTHIGHDNVVTTPVVIGQAVTLQSIAVTPVNPSVKKGLTQQFVATGTFSDNSQQDLSNQVAWGSANQAVATISATGLATAANVGTSTIPAAVSATTGTTTLTVRHPVATQLVLSTLPATNVTAGNTVTFTITAKDSGGAIVTGYAGTVNVTSTDPGAQFSGLTLPRPYTFSAA